MRRTGLVLSLVAAAALGSALGYEVARRTHFTPPGHPLRPDAELATGPIGTALVAALTDPDRLAGVESLASRLRQTGPESLDEVRNAFEAVFLDAAEIEVVLLAEWWAEFDPKAAFAWSRQSRIAQHALVTRSVIEAWARRDPVAARKALEGMLDPLMRRACLDSLISGWDASGQPGLVEYLRGLPAGVEPLMAMAPLARRRVLRDGPERSFAWAESLPEDTPEDALRFKLQMFRRVASAAASVEAEKTAAWAARHAEGPNGDGLLARVGSVWAEQPGRGEEALRWLSTLPAGRQRDDGVRDTFQAWAARANDEATDWLEAEPHAPWLEAAMLQHATRIARKQPEQALGWARRIEAEPLRSQAFVAVGNVWLQRDPDAARAWLDGAESTVQIREEILQLERARNQRRAQKEASDADDVQAAAKARSQLP
jgi:hypothetical protein